MRRSHLDLHYPGIFHTGHTDKTSIKIDYQPGSEGWAGVYWQYPHSNWGDLPGTRINKAKKIVFWARGNKGGEVVEFKAGGISNATYQDTFDRSTGKLTLTTDWKRYELDVSTIPSTMNLLNVIGAFAWTASAQDNVEDLVFYLDNIYYK